MCGIAGFAGGKRGRAAGELQLVADTMAHTMVHRGPDDAGCWIDRDAQVALGFRRLAILDLSDRGHQPMVSHCERYVIVFNGEIYNFRELRQDLESLGARFRGESDTEVLLTGIAHWGLPGALERTNGMFAFALWDRDEQVLSLARDRLGEKPMYYGRVSDGSFVFASELKAICVHPDFRPEIDRDVLALYFRYGCVPSPYSIYKGLAKLPPGTYLCINPNEPACDLTPTTYWSLDHAVAMGLAEPLDVSLADASNLLHDLLAESIRTRMIADVPVGAFLSGGIDSSTVVALMQMQASAPVRTFTIGFEEDAFNEATHARAIATHLGTDHTELYVSPEQALSIIPRLPSIYDEPFADPSAIPTFLVSELARSQVTVALTGDGGDELFGGYTRYLDYRSLHRVEPIPAVFKHGIAAALTLLSPRQWNSVFTRVLPLLPSKAHRQSPGDGIHRLAGALRTDHQQSLYRNLISHWDDPAILVIGAQEPPTVFTNSLLRFRGEPCSEAMAVDSVNYLPNDILAKIDRAAMATSLETRLPLLDHRVVELAWRFSPTLKIKRQASKRVLRSVLERYVPPSLTDRPKMGLDVPTGSWLRGPLRPWAEDLLNEQRLRREEFLDPQIVRQLWLQHQRGDRNWNHQLWDILMFESWVDATPQAPASTARVHLQAPVPSASTSRAPKRADDSLS